ncbi:MAG: hypothetical protein HDR46_04175 [Bacteroides sp.]|nr:hypothetical protein [Bacteroides sp.]
MNLIPKAVIDKLRELINLFTSDKFKSTNYKDELLVLAESDEEKIDLKELFQNTDDYYNEKKRINESGLTPSEYLKNLYLSSWKEEHPEASAEELRAAENEYEEILADAVIKELDALASDASEQAIIIPDIAEDDINNV